MRYLVSVSVGFAWLLAATPALSHHSFAAVFDIKRPVEFTGKVAELKWTNPHAWITIDVENSDGKVETWTVELLGINTLFKQGWRPDILKAGDLVHIKGFGARDGSTAANASEFTIVATGEHLWVSAPKDGAGE